MSGVAQDDKQSRRRRLKATAKAKSRQAAVLLDKARSRAAAALTPDPAKSQERQDAARTAEGERLAAESAPMTFTRRDTGALIEIRPPSVTDGLGAFRDTDELYAVTCLTHASDPVYFDTRTAATKAAKHSEDFCTQCEGIAEAGPKVSTRERLHAKATRGRD